MYSRNVFGSFYPVNSPIHSLNVVVKLINFLLFLLVLIGSSSIYLHIFILVLVFLEIILSKVPLRFYFNMFYSLRYIYVLLIFLFASMGMSLELSLTYLLKIILLTEYLALLIYTTSPSEMSYGIVTILNPFNFINFNLNKIALFFSNLIGFIPMLVSTEQRILNSQASRGLDYYHSGIVGRWYAVLNVLGNTFKITIHTMKVNKNARELRMFDIKKKRTNLNTNKVRFNDAMYLLFHLLFIYGYIIERGIL